MATYEYVIKQGCYQGNYVTKHYHTEYISVINNAAKANIPSGAVISKVELYLDANWDGSIGDPDLYFYFCPDDSSNYDTGDKLYSSTLDSESDIHTKDITSYVTKTYPFSINTSYPRVCVIYKSTLGKKYHCDDFKVIYTYSIPTYTLTVTAGTGGTVSGGGTYNNQATVTLKATPNTGYRFVKWNDDANAPAERTVTVTGNATYTATFEKLTYTVTWKNGDTVLETDTGVPYGTTPTYNGSTPTKASTEAFEFVFDGWEPSLSAVISNVTYTAKFRGVQRKYKIKWCNEDGSEIKTDEVAYGSTPVYNGSTPTKESTAKYQYVFSGWEPKVDIVTGNANYTAQFTAIIRTYIITASGENGTVTGVGTYDYGKTVTLTATANKGYDFKKWSDGVTTATRTVTVTGDAAYTAIFELLPPEIKSIQMLYLDKQISKNNRVHCGEGFVISVELS